MSQPVPIPNSEVRFYEDVPVSPSSGMQVAFNSIEQQNTFWERYRKITYTSTTYIHGGSLGSGHVTISADPVAALRWDHLSFLNPSYENKRFYCRIDSVEQVTANAVKVNFTVDHWQTWMFEARWQPCTIERQHITGSQWAQAVSNPYSSNVASIRSAEPINLTASMELFNADPDGTRVNSNGGHQGWHNPNDWFPSGNAEPVPSDTTPSGVEGYSTALLSSGTTTGWLHTIGLSGYVYENFPATQNISGAVHGYYLVILAGLTVAQSKALDDYLGTLPEDHPLRLVTHKAMVGSRYAAGSIGAYGITRLYIPAYAMSPITASTAISQVIDKVAGSGNTSSIMGAWVVPPEFMECDVQQTGFQQMINYMATEAPIFNMYKLPGMGFKEYSIQVPPLDEGFTNPKLRFAPFRHVRLTSPDGTFKEYAIEDFDGGTPKFRMYATSTDVPELTLVPVGYRGKTISWEERLVYSTFPMIPMKANGFTEYVYQKAKDSALNEPRYSKAARDQTEDDARGNNGFFAKIINKVVGTVGDLAVNTLAKVAGVTTTLATGNQTKGYEVGMSMAADPYEEVKAADEYAAGNGDAANELYAAHKNWVIGDGTYIPGNSAGSLSQLLGQQHFRLEIVTYRDEVYNDLERYLNSYGYADGSFDVPNLVRWVWGTGEKPHFASVNGIYSTYVKTLDAKVYGVHDTAAQAIKQMFDSGVRFRDGSI